MAKFCRKCGAELKEGVAFCGACGTAVVELTGKKNNLAGSETGKIFRAVSGNRKVFGLGIIALIVILVLGSLMKGSGAGFSSPEKAFEAYRNGQAHHEFDQMIKAYPDFVIKYYGGKGEFKEAWDREYGNGADSFTYKAVDHSTLDKNTAEEIEQKINNAFGSNVKISDVAKITYRLVNDEIETGFVTGGYAVKYKGKWFYIPFDNVA